jgi:predicted ester cyclase
MSEANKAVVRRFVEEFQAGGQREIGEELLATDFRNRTPNPGEPDDRNGVLNVFALLRTILPDLQAEIHDMLADGDRVATRKTFRGTHPGARGRPGTGRVVAIEVMDIVRVRDGQIVEHWNSVDRLSVARQLGVAGIVRIVARQAAAAARRRLQCR